MQHSPNYNHGMFALSAAIAMLALAWAVSSMAGCAASVNKTNREAETAQRLKVNP